MTVDIICVEEAVRLEELEATIERGMHAFVDVGNALLEIRDSRLYRTTHGTFEDYCRERWGFTDRRARMLIDASRAVTALGTGTMVPVLPQSERQTRPLTQLGPEQQREAWQRAVETAPEGKITAAHVQSVVEEYRQPAHLLISQSKSNEWYTPPEYVEAARAVMGGIDIDPASNDTAQGWIAANEYHTIDDDGLLYDWRGRVWLNPPWGKDGSKFVAMLVKQIEAGNTTEAVLLVNAHATDTKWFVPLWDGLLCFTDHRINYHPGAPDPGSSDDDTAKGGSTHGSVFVYFGPHRAAFIREFSKWGAIVARVGAA